MTSNILDSDAESEKIINIPAATVSLPKMNQKRLAWLDFMDALRKWPIWLMLAYQDIKLRYRRSVIGPFWLTLSMAITVYSMGYLYAHLFHVSLETYYPFLVAGMLGWSLISTAVIEFTDGLIFHESLIKQIKLPYMIHMHRIIGRNILIFFHNLLVMVPIYLIYPQTAQLNWNSLFLLAGLLIIYFNALTFGIVLSLIGARYRDISQVIKSLVQVIFFVTPIMWGPEVLMNKSHWIVDLNPFYAMLELIRQPLLGHIPNTHIFMNVVVMTLIGIIISSYLFTRHRSRIIYWL